MVPSHTIGELALMRLTSTVLCSTKSSPKTRFIIATLSAARSGAVTEPMSGLSL